MGYLDPLGGALIAAELVVLRAFGWTNHRLMRPMRQYAPLARIIRGNQVWEKTSEVAACDNHGVLAVASGSWKPPTQITQFVAQFLPFKSGAWITFAIWRNVLMPGDEADAIPLIQVSAQ